MSKRSITGLILLAIVVALAWVILKQPNLAPNAAQSVDTANRAQDDLPPLPEPVRATFRDLIAAADAQSFDQLQAIIDRTPSKQIKYTFGVGDEGAVAYWQKYEEDKAAFFQRMLEVLKSDYAFQENMIVWPSFFIKPASEATPAEVEQWEALAGRESYDYAVKDQGGYMGWRLAIDKNGNWLYYIAGD